MASVGIAPASDLRELVAVLICFILQDMEATVVDGNGTETGHIIVTTIGGRNGQPKQSISYMAERVVWHGSFGVVFQVKYFIALG
ncbi:hypothetical protein RD792_006032 [Penstemon davidsonii]|uniref:Uncharacterized protein n=1 Tax=Penstemon davidsonii TaxID=160366 RepID=A0ABR0CHW9_9LAMI|nr:hypothetical protein RD792_015908 [Penstemon davidsonii]KAK4493470.1 hypothetical protein RD792_006032 [Penstemon davidsonii]